MKKIFLVVLVVLVVLIGALGATGCATTLGDRAIGVRHLKDNPIELDFYFPLNRNNGEDGCLISKFRQTGDIAAP